ncbi:MAG: amidohydrolase [Bilophila wadsworthia]|uniref:amidohydrolase n=1 Tax=Bilophila wadsworthia TaxID=35833 RepID=UPI00300EB0C0
MKNRVKKQALSFAAVMAMILGGGMQLYAADKIADTVYRNGKIYTITETVQEAKDVKNAKKVDVVATLNGKIIFVGSEADAKAQGYLDENKVNKIVDLRGKTMLPGFVDGHGHFPGQGTSDLYKVNLNSPLLDGTVDTMDKLIEELRKKAETLPAGSPIIGWNYDDTQLAEQRHPTRYDLDKASTTHPIYVSHISGHMGAANSLALQKYNVTSATTTEGVEKDASGEPTGVLFETKAMGLVTLSNELETNDNFGIARASQVYAAAGVTTADCGGAQAQQIPAFQNTLDSNQLYLRVLVHPLGYYGYALPNGTVIDAMGATNRKAMGWKDTGDGKFSDATDAAKVGDDITSWNIGNTEVPANLPSDYLMLGAYKLLFDGSPQGYTAWMKSPGYYDWKDYTAKDSFEKSDYFIGLAGTQNIAPDVLTNLIKLFHAEGQSVEVHTNGSAAAEAYVSAIEDAVATYPDVKDTRHTSIHGQTMERQHVERLSGHYEDLEATAHMYHDLTGAYKDGKVDLTMGGKLPAGNLPELMKAQNTVNSYFDNHTYFYGYRHTNQFFGPGRAYNMSPAGWSEAYGQRYTFHNDTTITPISPLRSIQSAVTRVSGDAIASLGQENLTVNGEGKDLNATAQYKERITDTETRAFWTYDQRINPLQAIRANTITPAYQNKVEDRLGSIEEGKLADFVILDEDIMDVANSEPLRIAKMRVATTIVGDDVVYGFLPDTKSFASTVYAGYDQPSLEAVVTMKDSQLIDDVTAEKEYASLEANEKRFGTYSFTAEVEAGSSAIFQMDFLGNGEKVDALKLYKLAANSKTEYAYGRPSASEMASASGQWWIGSFDNPTVALPSDTVLEKDKTYVAFFIIRDNDATFDADTADGVIVDPVSLVSTTGTLPTNGGTADQVYGNDDGGSSSGCTVGSTPSYDLLVLFLGMSAVAAIRVLRRRND